MFILHLRTGEVVDVDAYSPFLVPEADSRIGVRLAEPLPPTSIGDAGDFVSTGDILPNRRASKFNCEQFVRMTETCKEDTSRT